MTRGIRIEGVKLFLKHIVKRVLGRTDKAWPFYRFERNIHPSTIQLAPELRTWADQMLSRAEEMEQDSRYTNSDNPLLRHGHELRRELLDTFRDAFRDSGERILVHVPPERVSTAGYSLFTNLTESFRFIGVPSTAVEWERDISPQLEDFRPTVFISSDSPKYLDRIDWNAVARYRSDSPLLVGLTASLEEYGNSPLEGRLAWAARNGISFYYSFRPPEYLNMRSAYQPFRDHGYRIISVEFGANPLVYYPVPGVTPDLDYVFLGSSNRRKQERYVRYFSRIVKHHVGLFQGPGFRFTHVDHIKPARDRYLLSRGRVGLNLSVPSQLSFPAELNERTYQLAACGVPQLIDHPQLLFKRFPQNAVFCGSEPDEYYRLFLHMLDQRDEARDRAMNALHTVYRRHSTFHRAADFLRGIGQVRAPA